ncbi:hypothetical protein SNARM312S_04352 [Streptomyces narbonensis]
MTRTVEAVSRTVLVAAFDGVRLLDVSAPLEVFATAGAGYEVRVCSPGGRDVRTACGLRIGADVAAEEVSGADTLIVPGAVDVELCTALAPTVAALAAGSRRVASVCTGAFALGAAGLLAGRRATTHWEHAAELARRHPDTEVTADAIHVRDGEVWSSAGVTAGIDLCLALVEEDRGPEAARAVARDLVVFLQRPGGQSQLAGAFSHPTGHPVVRPLLDAVAGGSGGGPQRVGAGTAGGGQRTSSGPTLPGAGRGDPGGLRGAGAGGGGADAAGGRGECRGRRRGAGWAATRACGGRSPGTSG